MKIYNEKEAAELSLDIGAGIVKSGGETSRAEDTVKRINISFGAKAAEVSALPSLIVATVTTKNGQELTLSKRVKEEQIDLAELDRLNALSRRICSGDKTFIELVKSKEYSNLFDTFCTAVATSSFCLYFGGSYLDAIISALIGLVITYLHLGFTLSSFMSTLLSGGVAGVLSFFPSFVGINTHPDKIMIGTIMLLVPGLTVSNAARDIVFGDTLSGILRLVDSVFTALAIAFGFAFGLSLFGSGYIG